MQENNNKFVGKLTEATKSGYDLRFIMFLILGIFNVIISQMNKYSDSVSDGLYYFNLLGGIICLGVSIYFLCTSFYLSVTSDDNEIIFKKKGLVKDSTHIIPFSKIKAYESRNCIIKIILNDGENIKLPMIKNATELENIIEEHRINSI